MTKGSALRKSANDAASAEFAQLLEESLGGSSSFEGTVVKGRVVRISKKFYAHDEKREAKQGDTVCISSSRPLSRLKRWRLKSVLTRETSAKQK